MHVCADPTGSFFFFYVLFLKVLISNIIPVTFKFV